MASVCLHLLFCWETGSLWGSLLFPWASGNFLASAFHLPVGMLGG